MATTIHKPIRLLWIDTETTGLNPNTDTLLEIAMRITDLDGQPTDTQPLTTTIAYGELRLEKRNIPAIRTHLTNNLIDTCLDQQATTTKEKITTTINNWLRKNINPQYEHRIAGTNPQFDLRWLHSRCGNLIKNHPAISHRLHDMTALRTTLEHTGLRQHDHTKTNHRANTCLDRDITQYQDMVKKLRSLA